MKDGLVRAEQLPLVFRALGAESLPRGALVRVRLAGHDLLTLDLQAAVTARIDDAATAAPAQQELDEVEEGLDEADGAGTGAGPLELAIEVQEDGDAERQREDDAAAPASA
jgi:exoribonuclease-2